MISIEHNLDALNRILPEYGRLRGMTTAEVLVKTGTKLAFALGQRLTELAPGKGSIRSERLSAMRSGEGTLVRPGIRKRIMDQYGAAVPLSNKAAYLEAQKRTEKKFGALTGLRVKFGKRKSNAEGAASVSKKGKKLNLQALMVQAEINAREKGSKYLGWGAKTDLRGIALVKNMKHFGRYKQELAKVGLGVNELGQELRFTYGGAVYDGMPVDLGIGMQTPKAQAKIAQAIGDVRKDTNDYLVRKHTEALQAAIRNGVATAGRVIT